MQRIHSKVRKLAAVTAFVAAAAAVVAGAVTAPGARAAGGGEVKLLNVSYDPTRELYDALNGAFAARWKAKTARTSW